DFLSLHIIAATGPVVLCPAMNVEMWNNAATQENVAKLMAHGIYFVNPVSGHLACGEHGLGHIADFDSILFQIRKCLREAASNLNILISFGSMRTPIDSVRYVANSSSGRTGIELVR